MSYYQGDFYMGDPGFFSFLGKAAKAAVGFIPGVGPALSSGLSMVRKSPTLARAASAGRAGMAIASKHPVMTAAGAAGVIGGGGMLLHGKAGRGTMAAGGRIPSTVFRRHRRMRVTNPKALRRAIRRTQGFAKLAMRTIHLVHPKKRARFGGFRKRRAKR